jgi:hypothetical protein
MPIDFMKNRLFILSFALFLGCQSSAWAQRIAMIDIKATDEEFINNFGRAGMNLISRSTKQIVMQGVLIKESNTPITLIADLTPISHVVYRVTVRHKTLFTSVKPKQKWMEAKSHYESKKEKMISRYGTIFKEERVFEKPFKEGKGKELKAISIGKARWMSDWGEMQYFQNLYLTLRIDSEGDVLVEYWVKDSHLKFLEEEKLTQNQL